MSAATPAPSGTTRGGALAPLALPVFRALWLAVLVSNIGSWMQTVGAQWLLIDEHASPAVVAPVQTAASLPVLLIGIPAGGVALQLPAYQALARDRAPHVDLRRGRAQLRC